MSSVRNSKPDPATGRHYVYERTTVIAADHASPIKTTTIIESRAPPVNQGSLREEREVVTTYTRATPNNLENSLLHRSIEDKSGSKDKAAYTPTRSYTKVEKRTTLESSSATRVNQNAQPQHPGISSASRDRRERYGAPVQSSSWRDDANRTSTTGTRTHHHQQQQQQHTEMSYSAVKERSPTSGH